MNDLLAEARRLLPNFSTGTSVVYFMRLHSGVIYIGASTDLEQRLADHVAGVGCRTTLLDPPATLLRLETFTTFVEARSRETQLKRWSRAKKEALIAGNFERLQLLSRSRY